MQSCRSTVGPRPTNRSAGHPVDTSLDVQKFLLSVPRPRPVTQLTPACFPLLRHAAVCSTRSRLTTTSARGPAAKAAQDTVIIVESPTKAQKVQQFLGPSYKVLASYGHVRKLPAKAGSVQPHEEFHLVWDLTPGAAQRLKEIKDAVQGAHKVLLATDPDREGEAIAWHLTEELQAQGSLHGQAVQRISFAEITRTAVLQALRQPRQVSSPLVEAYLARTAVDYLLGFHLSPLLWRKLPGARSAGRVQSVALRLVCDRDAEIQQFQSQESWTVDVKLQLQGSDEPLVCRLVSADGVKLGLHSIKTQQQAEELKARIEQTVFQIASVSTKTVQRSPPPPFITSTLQQEAARRLGYSAKRTMQLAQQLYEGAGTGEGLITYMRTDGVQLSASAVSQLRDVAQARFGQPSIPSTPRLYKSRAKNAQEAHEAIRPTQPHLTSEQLPAAVDDAQRSLYQLIWRRALACQMSNAVFDQVSVDLSSLDGSLVLHAAGSALKSPGYLSVYDDAPAEDDSIVGGQDDEAAPPINPRTRQLQQLQVGQQAAPVAVQADQHFSRPPPRYNDASLIKTLEEKGIGRPSTYASILGTIQERGYVSKEGRTYYPTSLGRLLTAFLMHYFPRYVDYEFTSHMEEQLDDVSGGKLFWKAVVSDFWNPFCSALDSMQGVRIQEVFNQINQALEPYVFPSTPEDSTDPRACPQCGNGRLSIVPSRYGGFIGCSNSTNTDIRCSYVRPLGVSRGVEDNSSNSNLTQRDLGLHPDTGEMITARLGPFGAYVQLGDSTSQGSNTKKAAKRAGLQKGQDISTITLEEAVTLLALPRALGTHPADGQPVYVNVGRFGPYVHHGKLNASLGKRVSMDDITLDVALGLLDRKQAKLGSGGRGPTFNMKKACNKSARTQKKVAPADGTHVEQKTGKRKPAGSLRDDMPAAATASRRNIKQEETRTSSKGHPRSGYHAFICQAWQLTKAANPGARYSEWLPKLAAQWRGLSEYQKQTYKDATVAKMADDA